MNREMFRGQRIDDREWVEGWYSYNPIQKRGLITNWDDERCYVFEVIPETVGQYTGIKDKNGKDLDWWEDDIFKHPFTDYPLIMTSEDGCWWFKLSTGKVRYKCYDVLVGWEKLPEKCGNIHEGRKNDTRTT